MFHRFLFASFLGGGAKETLYHDVTISALKTMSVDNSYAIEVSRTEGNLWSTVIVRRGQHLIFSASHRDVLTALLMDFDGATSACVFHGDSLQDVKGRFFLGYKPTLCTSYNISTTQSTTAVLHPTIPHHIARGVRGAYIVGQRTLALKAQQQQQVQQRSLSGRPLIPASDAWWMGSSLSLYPIVVPLPISDENVYEENHRFSIPLEARLVKEWITLGTQYCLALTKENHLRLATTEYLVSSSVVKWEWQSKAIPFALNCDGVISATVSNDSESFARQVLFVFSEGSQKVAVYRTSPLRRTAQCDLTLELLAILPTSCAAFPIEMFPLSSGANGFQPSFVQPIAVVRGWCIELFCPYTISHSTSAAARPPFSEKGAIISPEKNPDEPRDDENIHPFATLHFSTVDLQEGIMDVLSVSRCSIRAVAPSMDVRVVDIPNLHISSHPILKHIFSTLAGLEPLLPLSRSYELLQWLVSSLWHVTGDMDLSSHWTAWNAFTERLKCIFVNSLATKENFNKLCEEHDDETPQHSSFSELRSLLENGVAPNAARASVARFVDPIFINSAMFDMPPSGKFGHHAWNYGSDCHESEADQSASTESRKRHGERSQDSNGQRHQATQWTPKECAAVALGLHLLYESLKIWPSYWSELPILGALLADLCAILGLQQFVRYHTTLLCISENRTPTMRAFEQNEDRAFSAYVSKDDLSSVFGQCSDALAQEGIPFDIHAILADVFHSPQHASKSIEQWPVVQNLSDSHPIRIATSLLEVYHRTFFVVRNKSTHGFRTTWWSCLVSDIARCEALQEAVTRGRLSIGATQLLLDALHVAKDYAEDDWPEEVKHFVGRIDKLLPTSYVLSDTAPSSSAMFQTRDAKILRLASERAIGKLYNANLVDDDGVQLDAEFSRRWADGRLDVVQSMLSTAAPIPIPGRGDGTDAMHAALKTLSRRALAFPLARGMLTLSTKNFRVLDVIPTPPLVLEGRTNDGILIVNELAQTPEVLVWPTFHNGCAAGLRFLPLVGGGASQIGSNGEWKQPVLSRHWVVYQTRGSHNIPSKGGLLYAAGLLGHLRTLQLTDIYTLLATSQAPSTSSGQSRARDPLTLAVILGLSCSFRGTHHEVVFRCLSVHLQSLTPTNADLDVSIEVQIGALYGMGLLCQGSGDTFLVDMLLNEMARLPSDEHYKNRRGYSLAAGVSLGLILLGKGRGGDGGIEDRLLKIMNGAPRDTTRVRSDPVAEFESLMPDSGHFLTRALLHRVSCPVSPPCTKVLEGPQYNVSVSGPGAIMALGLMYIKTNDSLMASRLAPPRTIVGAEGIFPEHCHLRSCLAALVMWDNIKPTAEWLYSNISKRVLNVVQRPEDAAAANISPPQVRYLAMNCGHMLAGSVLAMGMRFAGSMSAHCRNLILAELNGFVAGKIGSTSVVMNQVQKATNAFESCIASCAVALGLVMAGTGDSASFRALRRILKKPNVTYGTHLSVSMAVGLLFLGGGNLTLSNSASSVAALLIAFYPCWPRDFSDNADHLQILRHLYVLAAEGRLLETVDAETNQPLSLQVRVHVSSQQRVQRDDDASLQTTSSRSGIWTPLPKDGNGKANDNVQVVQLTTPCLLPELHTIDSIEIRSSEHYPLTIRGSDLQLPVTSSGGTITIRVQPRSHSKRTPPESKLMPKSAKPNLLVSESSGLCCVADQSLKDSVRLLLLSKLRQPLEAMLAVDNFKLLFQLSEIQHTKLLPPTSSQHGGDDVVTSLILSRNLVEQVKRFMAYHYNPMLTSTPTTAAVSEHRRHPLDLALNKRLSASDISSAAVHHSDDGNTVDFAPFCELRERRDDSPEEWSKWRSNVEHVTRWVSQALHYYSLALPSGSFSSSVYWLLDTIRPINERGMRRVQIILFAASQRSAMTLEELEKLLEICLAPAESSA